MGNPLNDVQVFQVIAFEKIADRGIGGVVSRKITQNVVLSMTRSRNCRAYKGYSDTVLAIANGYGYDKRGVALALAIKKLTGVTLKNGAAGVQPVMEDALTHGIEVTVVV